MNHQKEKKEKKHKIVLSASRVKTFLDCPHLFYQTYFLKVPEPTHPKTKLGSIVHVVLELLSKPKHKKHYDKIMTAQDVYASPAITRLVNYFWSKNPDITEVIKSDFNDLCFVALNNDFFFKGASKVLPPEYDFEIDYGDFAIKGFLDRLALYDGIAKIRDYKTQKSKFTQEELGENLQAFFYQLAVKHFFNLPAEVEFVLLRHGPNKRDKKRHLQIVPPTSDLILEGFKLYLKEINDSILNLNENNSISNLKSERNPGFCRNVCKLKDPFVYWVVLEGDKIIASSKEDNLIPKENQIVEKRYYRGCPSFY